MTDAQLSLLLEAMQNELEITLEVCRANVPEGIEYPKGQNYLGQEVTLEYAFLYPIVELREKWEKRIKQLRECEPK